MDIEESGHTDVASAKNQVKVAMSALEKMRTELGKLDDEGSLPSWWTNKVAIAVDKLDGMADYLDTQVEENKMEDENEKEMNEDNELIQRVANAISFYEAKISKKASLKFAKTFPRAKSTTGYELYHNDFSSAMQHAYAFAKKKYGITIDPEEIDDKVATGPKKPSKDKTNRYRLKGDKGTVQIQVTNLDNRKFELNMYKEEVKLDEVIPKSTTYGVVVKGKFIAKGSKANMRKLAKEKGGKLYNSPRAKVGDSVGKSEEVELDEAKYEYDGKVVKISKKEFRKVHKDYKNTTKGKERMLVLDPKTQGTISVPVQFEEVELDEKVQFEAPTKDGNTFQVIDHDTKGMRGKQDKFKMQIVDKRGKVIKDLGSHASLNGAKGMAKNRGIIEEVELDENAAVKALTKQADVSNPTDKKFFQKAAELLKKKDFVALGQHIYDYDTDEREFVMSTIRDKDKASFKKMYGDQKGYFSTMKPKGLKEEADENIQRVANAISFYEAKRMSPAARARRDALRDIGGREKENGEDEVKATDADRERADRNIINKLKKAADVRGNYEIKFDKGPSKKIPFKLLTLVLKKLDKMKPADKLKFQKQAEKSYADFLKAVKDIAR